MAEPLVFVHAADLHLDAPFRRVDAADRRVREACVEATFAAFDRIVGVCLERDAAFLVIAGDAYDTADRSFRAQNRFRAAAERLAEAGIRVFVAGGNHDPVLASATPLEMPGNVHVFSAGEVERVAFPDEDDPRCVLYGRSYGRARETSNLARGYRRAATDPFAIGVLHANVGGDDRYEPYAPCSLEDLRAAGMDYWALGHIHQHQELSKDPPVVFPGSPQGLDPNEVGGHGCVVVTVAPNGSPTLEFVETGQLVWERLAVDLTEADTADDVLSAVREACERARTGAGGRPVLLRLELLGRTGAHGVLARGALVDELVAEVRAEQLTAEPWVWLDRVTDHTRPVIDLERIRGGADFAAEVVRIADAIDHDSASAMVGEVLEPLQSSVRDLDLELDAAVVVERARDRVLDALLAGEEGR